MLPDIVREAYQEYLDYLNASGTRLRIPDIVHDPNKSAGKVHASAIGRCPKKAALSRDTNIDVKMFSFSTQHLMEQGKRDAEPIQEAMWYKYPMNAEPEFSVEKPPFRGRVDIKYNDSLVEIKRRDGYKDKSGNESSPTPYLTDLYQMICYSYMTGYDDIWLCLVTRFNLYFYALTSALGGFILIDEYGEKWKSEFNNPSYLNYDVILAHAATHQQYLNGERSDDPLPFYLNRGFECGHYKDNVKPKRYKVGYNGQSHNDAYFVPTCPFFSTCKGITIPEDGKIRVIETEYDSKDYQLA